MDELLQIRHQLRHEVGRWRHEARIARPGAANPVLGAPEFAGLRLLSATMLEQQGVHLADHPHGNGPALRQAFHAVANGGNVVGDLLRAGVGRHARRGGVLVA